MPHMKTLLLSLCLAAAIATAEERLDPKANLKTVTLVQLNALEILVKDGTVFKVKVASRDNSIAPVDGTDTLRAMLWDGGFGRMEARFPKDALQWVARIGTAASNFNAHTFIARCVKDADGGFHLDLLGRNVETDSHGPKVVWK